MKNWIPQRGPRASGSAHSSALRAHAQPTGVAHALGPRATVAQRGETHARVGDYAKETPAFN